MNTEDSGSYDHVFFIYNDVCKPPGGGKNAPLVAPYGIGNNLLFYDGTSLSGDFLAELHTSCSAPIFVGLEFGPNTKASNNHECTLESPPVCNATNPTFEIIGTCNGNSVDNCEGYIKQGWPFQDSDADFPDAPQSVPDTEDTSPTGSPGNSGKKNNNRPDTGDGLVRLLRGNAMP